jgi:hypothetical protein
VSADDVEIVRRWRESGEVAYEKRARLEYTLRDGKIVRYEARFQPDEGGEADA